MKPTEGIATDQLIIYRETLDPDMPLYFLRPSIEYITSQAIYQYEWHSKAQNGSTALVIQNLCSQRHAAFLLWGNSYWYKVEYSSRNLVTPFFTEMRESQVIKATM